MKPFLLFIVSLPLICFSQKQGNIWYFGTYAGLDFNTGNPVALNDSHLSSPEGTAVISDNTGSLLFYTNGFQVLNRNHKVMPGGDSLAGNTSSTQAALIIPQPGSSRYFYVFTTDDFQHHLINGLRYSVVDMCLDNGFGDVMTGKKNIFVTGPVAEKLTGVRHKNGIDYWVLCHLYNSDAFCAYQLSATGIINMVVSNVGSVHFGGSMAAAIGQMKASPDGKRIAIVNGNTQPSIAEYFDFNNSTGVVSNCVSVQTNPYWNYYGISFSPDNSKLYISSVVNGNGIYQFDLNAGGGNPAYVIASKTKVAFSSNYLGLQLATDGKIYSARSPFGGFAYLGVINYPNNTGTSCNYVDAAVSLDGHSSGYGFPNFVDSYDYSNTAFDCNKNDDPIIIFPNPFSTFVYIVTNEPIEFTLYDCIGRKVLNKSIENSGTINTEQFSCGIYLYELQSNSGTHTTGKLIKQY